MILAIDASTTATGYAHGGGQDAFPRGGVWRLPGADAVVIDRTITMLGQSIMELARVVKPTAIYIEAPLDEIDREHGRHTWAALMQLTGGMRLACGLLQCRIELCAVSYVRRYFIGSAFLSGSEAKARVMERCDGLGWRYQDDNQADANAVWAYAMAREVKGWQPNAPQLFDESNREGKTNVG